MQEGPGGFIEVRSPAEPLTYAESWTTMNLDEYTLPRWQRGGQGFDPPRLHPIWLPKSFVHLTMAEVSCLTFISVYGFAPELARLYLDLPENARSAER
jgi:hypothetical protein